jgi:hypothetical protein
LHSQCQEPKHLKLALSYEGHTEVNKNSSPEIDKFLKYTGFPPGTPYCAAFVSSIIGWSDVSYPKIKTALATNFITPKSVKASDVLIGIKKVKSGDIIVWRKGETIFGHTGFVVSWDQKSGKTIEANTSSGSKGSQRDGEGIYVRYRTIIPGAAFRITHFTPVIYE